MNWIQRLKRGLTKTAGSITSAITNVFTTKTLNDETLCALEDILISADISVATASELVESLRKDKFQKDITAAEVQEYLAGKISEMLLPYAKPLEFTGKPHVVLMCGANGSGKTTTIGKIAHQLKQQGKTVLLAACDTFRAAADLQLEAWAQRTGCELIRGGSDAASVAYRALEKAIAEKTDVLFIDTAGRLQNKQNLMDELAKIIRVLKKLDPSAPHDTILVLDACIGQNAIMQVAAFKEIANLTGLIVTKLDGTAKGGIIVALSQKFHLPIHLIGVGESLEDLDVFDPELFSNSLFDIKHQND